MLAGALLMIPVPSLAVFSIMSKGLVWGEGFAWDWGPSACLPEYVDLGTVFPLLDLDAYPVTAPLTPDAPVFGPHQSDGNHTLDVSARP